MRLATADASQLLLGGSRSSTAGFELAALPRRKHPSVRWRVCPRGGCRVAWKSISTGRSGEAATFEGPAGRDRPLAVLSVLVEGRSAGVRPERERREALVRRVSEQRAGPRGQRGAGGGVRMGGGSVGCPNAAVRVDRQERSWVRRVGNAGHGPDATALIDGCVRVDRGRAAQDR